MPFTFYLLPFLRWAFTRFYREFAWTYDAVAALVSRGYWRRWTLAALPYIHGRVLELGCGTGNVQLALAQQNQPRVAIDASPQMLNLTRVRLQSVGLVTPLVRGIAQALPLASSSCDSVLATFPTEYIIDPRTLAEVRRVLASGGRLLIVDAAYFTSDGPYERLIDLLYRATLQGSTRSIEHTPPPDQRLVALEKAGFAVQLYWETIGHSRVMVMVGT